MPWLLKCHRYVAIMPAAHDPVWPAGEQAAIPISSDLIHKW
jgi:hypothetical protein